MAQILNHCGEVPVLGIEFSNLLFISLISSDADLMAAGDLVLVFLNVVGNFLG